VVCGRWLDRSRRGCSATSRCACREQEAGDLACGAWRRWARSSGVERARWVGCPRDCVAERGEPMVAGSRATATRPEPAASGGTRVPRTASRSAAAFSRRSGVESRAARSGPPGRTRTPRVTIRRRPAPAGSTAAGGVVRAGARRRARRTGSVAGRTHASARRPRPMSDTPSAGRGVRPRRRRHCGGWDAASASRIGVGGTDAGGMAGGAGRRVRGCGAAGQPAVFYFESAASLALVMANHGLKWQMTHRETGPGL
jgi:hypothetical protein